MNGMHEQDAALNAALQELDARDNAPVTSGLDGYVPPPAPRRRVPPRVIGDAGDYVVDTPPNTSIRVVASSYGDAVIESMSVAQREKIANYGGLIFMEFYAVTNDDNGTRYGRHPEMRDELERARIERSAERARRSNIEK